MEAVLATMLASPMVLVVSLADEPAVEDSQFDWPLKLKLWFRASSAWAVSTSSLMTAWRSGHEAGNQAEHQDGEDEQDFAGHQGATAVVVPHLEHLTHGRRSPMTSYTPRTPLSV